MSSFVASPVRGQSRLYTNADLGKPLVQARTPTVEEMQGLIDRQFTLPPDYDGPKALVLPYDPTWPFTYAQRLEPDPWSTPGGLAVYDGRPFYGGHALNRFGIYSRPDAFRTRLPPNPEDRSPLRKKTR
jgi:hypothetical protein